MKKNILVIHHGTGIGGGLIALVGLVDELKQKHNVKILCLFNSVAVDYLKENGNVVLLPTSKFYSRFYSLFIHSEASYFDLINFKNDIFSFFTFLLSKYFFAKIELKSKLQDVDIVYLNSTFIADFARSANKLNKKVIIHVREPIAKGVIGLRYTVIRNSIKKYCHKIIAISYDNAKRINVSNKTQVVYDPVVKRNRSSFIDLKYNKDLKYFLYLGGYARIKGFEQLVNSIKYLDDDIRIFFLGGIDHYSNNKLKHMLRILLDPYYRRRLELITELKESNSIINIGLTENVFRYFDNSIALISPFSKPHASLPILESFSMGKPVIVSDIEGMDELVNPRNGFFFKNNNPLSLAKSINEVASLSTNKYEKFKKNSLITYEQIIIRKETVLSVVDTL